MPDGKVQVMRLEDYLRGVVPVEMADTAPMEALKAQAVAARCFAAVAVANPRHSGQGADVCTETHCQGWSARTRSRTDQAIEETADVVALYEDEVIQAFYFAHCDGHTRNSEDVWARALPYCRSVPCVKPYPSLSGHGVGMCQQGAIAMADQGATYVDILSHYYTGIEVLGADRSPVNTWPELATGYATWPRPPQDNGMGIHGGLDFSGEAIAADVARALELKVKWVTLVPQTREELKRAAQTYWGKGIMPVVRPRCLVDVEHDFLSDARQLQDLGIPAYVQVYNAPEQRDEWKSGQPDLQAFASRWLAQARPLVDAGAFPGLQVNSISDLRAVLDRAKREGLEHLFRHSWFSAHNYGLNRPARFPYDEVNQKALAVQHPEWEFAAPIEQINRWREEGKRPGQSVYDDYQCVMGFLAYARAFEEALGYVPPIICAEGGWRYGDLTDRRYPKVDDFLHQAHHLAMYAWFKDGVLADGSRLPDYLFAVCPWILSGGGESSAWYGGPNGTRYQTVRAMAALPRFLRGGAIVEQPAPAPETPAVPPPSPSPAPRPSPVESSQRWQMSVEHRPRSDGIRAIAGSFPRAGIRLEVVDPWGNSVAVVSGSKSEYGPGGFEVPVWADALFTLRFLDESFQVEVRGEVLVVTFSEKTSPGDDGQAVEGESRLISDWMEAGAAEELFAGLSRYEGLFALQRQ